MIEDRGPAVDRQKLRHQLAAEEPAQRCAGEDDHDPRGAKPVRQIIGCQRHGRWHQRADAQAGDEAQRREHREWWLAKAQAKDDTISRIRLASSTGLRPSRSPIGPEAQRADHDADAGHDEGAGEGGAGQMPGLRQRRHRHADAAEVVAVEGLRQQADRRDAKLQRADALARECGFSRGKMVAGHDFRPPCGRLSRSCVGSGDYGLDRVRYGKRRTSRCSALPRQSATDT